MESFIGKTYRPYDNSWSVNVTKSGIYPYKNEQKYLAETSDSLGVDCVIVSEPFECQINIDLFPEIKGIKTMIMVEYEKETHMVLFDKSYVI